MRTLVVLAIVSMPFFAAIAFKNPFMILLGIVYFTVFTILYYFKVL